MFKYTAARFLKGTIQHELNMYCTGSTWITPDKVIRVVSFKRIFNFRTGPIRLESLIKEIIPKKLTGLLRVTFDACCGVIAFDEGVVVDGYEIFNDELLVKDQNGRHIVERHKAEPGKIALYEVQEDVLHSFLTRLQERPPTYQALLQSVAQQN